MGNNASMTAFEATVISLYDKGLLTLETLDAVAEPYRDTDIDLGGMMDLETKDGKDLFHVVVELVQPGILPDTDPWEDGATEPCWYCTYSDIASERFGFR